MEQLLVQACFLNNSKKKRNFPIIKFLCFFRSLSPSVIRITSYTLSETHELYLRLTPVITGTYICRSRPAVISMNKEEITIPTTSITLTAQS